MGPEKSLQGNYTKTMNNICFNCKNTNVLFIIQSSGIHRQLSVFGLSNKLGILQLQHL